MRPITLFSISACAASACALRAPLRRFGLGTEPSSSLMRRQGTSGSVSSVPLVNTGNTGYYSNLTLGGVALTVIMDLGSSDLWVANAIPGAADTGTNASINFAVGTAAGEVMTADAVLGTFTVKSQAFIYVKDTSSFGSIDPANGLLGLGPGSGSLIDQTFNGNVAADTFLDRVFQQNVTSDNFITISLSRLNDLDSAQGDFTISEVIPGYEAVTSQSKLALREQRKNDPNQHWITLIDKDGVIGPDGQPIDLPSTVSGVPSGQYVAVFDSGFTLPQLPRNMSDAIYGRVQGAEWNALNETWYVPCDQELNVTFVFGGVKFPMNPLDIASSDFGVTDSKGNKACFGLFQPITSGAVSQEYDIILGMAAMRNIYTLFNFGNFVGDSQFSKADPYIQLLPTTDPAKAHGDFVTTRLGGVDTTGDPSKALLPANQEQHSPTSPGDPSPSTSIIQKVKSLPKTALIGGAVGAACLLGLLLICCCCRGRGDNVQSGRGGWSYGQQRYLPIANPNSAPPSYPMTNTARDPYRDPYNTGYA